MHAFRALLTLALLGTAGVWLSSCGGGDGQEAQAPADETAETSTGAAVPIPQVSTEPGPVVATVNGVDLHERDVNRVYGNLSRQNIPPDSTVAGDTEEERLQATALKLLVDQELLKQAAAREGITASQEDVAMQLTQIKAQSGGDVAFQQLIAATGATEDDVKRDIGDNMVLREYFRRHVDTEVTPEGAREFFEANPGLFDEVQAEHILIRTDADMDDMAKATARSKAAEALEKIRGGMAFAEAVTEYSEDETTRGNAGSLGWFSRGQMVPPFEQAAFALEEGEVSELVETQFGIHIIHLSGRRPATERSWEEMERRVMLYQQAKKQTDGAQAAVESLRTTATIVYP